MYYCYVDGTLCLFKNEKDDDSFLAFLNVFAHKTSTVFLTSVYRKLTFSSLYTR